MQEAMTDFMQEVTQDVMPAVIQKFILKVMQ